MDTKIENNASNTNEMKFVSLKDCVNTIVEGKIKFASNGSILVFNEKNKTILSVPTSKLIYRRLANFAIRQNYIKMRIVKVSIGDGRYKYDFILIGTNKEVKSCN